MPIEVLRRNAGATYCQSMSCALQSQCIISVARDPIITSVGPRAGSGHRKGASYRYCYNLILENDHIVHASLVEAWISIPPLAIPCRDWVFAQSDAQRAGSACTEEHIIQLDVRFGRSRKIGLSAPLNICFALTPWPVITTRYQRNVAKPCQQPFRAPPLSSFGWGLLTTKRIL